MPLKLQIFQGGFVKKSIDIVTLKAITSVQLYKIDYLVYTV